MSILIKLLLLFQIHGVYLQLSETGNEKSVSQCCSVNTCGISQLVQLINDVEKLKKEVAELKGTKPEKDSRDCADWKEKGFDTSGIYEINPDNNGKFKVYCDMLTKGGGWIVIQRRADGSEDFYRTWTDYKQGFGSLNNEFWLGNDKINRLTRKGDRVLRFDLEDTTGEKRFAEYSSFGIASEKEKYKLSVGSYSGTAGDSFGGRQRNAPFSTKDRDNDAYTGGNCAKIHTGAWWYAACQDSNLNGRYLNGHHNSRAVGINWKTWLGLYNSLRKTEIKVRPALYLA